MTLRNVFPSAMQTLTTTYKKWRNNDVEVSVAELQVTGKVLRYVIDSRVAQWRVNSLFTKEPMTIEWLHSFQPGEVLVDVGANIGMYSCYAAQVSGARVFSFEPESQNYAELNRNIVVNEASEKITAWCAALAEHHAVSCLLLNTFGVGLSHHDFAITSRPRASTALRQGAVGFSLDALISEGALPTPDHIKIDVDGHENLVVKGMKRLLEGDQLKTILIECDPRWPHILETVDSIQEMGYVYNIDEFRLTRDGVLDANFVHDAFRRKQFGNNIVFSRDPRRIDYATRWLAALGEKERSELNVTPEEWYRNNPGLV
jgi:FkbM family methyltransferase